MPFLCQAVVGYLQTLSFHRRSQNIGICRISVSRGVQKLEQGGVRAAFMGAVQVGSKPKYHRRKVKLKKSPLPQKSYNPKNHIRSDGNVCPKNNDIVSLRKEDHHHHIAKKIDHHSSLVEKMLYRRQLRGTRNLGRSEKCFVKKGKETPEFWYLSNKGKKAFKQAFC